MSGEKIRPRFELEETPLERLEVLPPSPPATGRRLGTAGLVLAGLLVLGVGLAALEIGNFIAAQFARNTALGWLTLAVAGAGFGFLGAGLWRELRGLAGLRSVEALRAALADPDTRRDAARAWLKTLPEGPALLPAIEAANDPDSILALLRAGPGTDQRARAQALGRSAATQIFALTAAVPSPALDGLAVAWRGVRLIREIAAVHGMRPGLFGSLSLLRRTAIAAAHTGVANFAADAVVRAAVSNPLLGHVAGDMAGAGIAARRMMALARAAEAACSPLPPE